MTACRKILEVGGDPLLEEACKRPPEYRTKFGRSKSTWRMRLTPELFVAEATSKGHSRANNRAVDITRWPVGPTADPPRVPALPLDVQPRPQAKGPHQNMLDIITN